MKSIVASLAFIGTFFNLIHVGLAVGRWDKYAVEWLVKVGKALSDPENSLLEYMTKEDYVANEYNLEDRNRLKLDDIKYICQRIASSSSSSGSQQHQIQYMQVTCGLIVIDAWSDGVYRWLLELGQFMKPYGYSVDTQSRNTRTSYAMKCRVDYEGRHGTEATSNDVSITYICELAKNLVNHPDPRISSRTYQQLLLGCRWAKYLMSAGN